MRGQYKLLRSMLISWHDGMNYFISFGGIQWALNGDKTKL